MGQELRLNDVNVDLTPFQDGNRALTSKDMRKSQGKVLLTDMYEYIEVLNNWFLILL